MVYENKRKLYVLIKVLNSYINTIVIKIVHMALFTTKELA